MEMQGQQKTKNRSFIHRLLLTTVYLLPACFGLLLTTVYLLLSAPSAQAGTIIKGPAYLGLQKGLIGCWTFDGASSYASDCSGYGNKGTLTNGPIRLTGIIGQALRFDGTNDYSVSALVTQKTKDVTLSAWFRTSDYTQDRQVIVYNGNGSTSGYGIIINQESESVGNLRILYGGVIWFDTGTDITDTNWHHVALVLSNATPPTKYVYLDNQLIYTNAASTPLTPTTGTAIGNDNQTGTGTPYFKGDIDDVRIFDRPLTANEITRMYKIGLGSKTNRSAGIDQFDKGLVGHWTFDGADISGTRAKDRSGNNYHGTLTGAPLKIQGKIGQGLSFDGTSDYIDAGQPAALAFGTGDFTVSLWAKTTSTAFKTMIGTYIGGAWYISNGDGGASPGVLHFNDGNIIKSTRTINDGAWHLLTVRRASGLLYIYIDGQSAATPVSSTISYAVAQLYIANIPYDTIYKFPGSLDDVRIYNRALSAAEIKRLYDISQPKVNATQTTLDKGLVGHWTLDGNDIGLSGTRAEDRSGMNNHGTLTNGPTQQIGKIGQAINFDGSNDYITVSNSTSLNTLATLSISFWIKSTLAGATDNDVVLEHGSGNNGYHFQSSNEAMDNGGNHLLFGVSSNATTGRISTAGVVFDGRWHHVGAVFNNGADTMQIYLDGVLDKNKTGITDAPTANGAALTIGSRAGTIAMPGTMDDIRIYNRSLSAGEINKLYQMGR